MGNINYSIAQINSSLAKLVRGVYRGFIRMGNGGTTTTLGNAEQWYPVLGAFTDDGIDNGFTTSASGVLTFTGTEAVTVLINGTADLSVDKGCVITFGTFLNGVLVPNSLTPHTFTNTSKVSNISIDTFGVFNPNDTMQVYVKSDTANVNIDVNTLRVTVTEH